MRVRGRGRVRVRVRVRVRGRVRGRVRVRVRVRARVRTVTRLLGLGGGVMITHHHSDSYSTKLKQCSLSDREDTHQSSPFLPPTGFVTTNHEGMRPAEFVVSTG